MIANNGKPRWFFYLGWVVLNFIAIVMAWSIAGALLSQIAKIVGDTIQVGGQSLITEEYLFSYALFPIIGLLTGILQYALLRRYLPHMAWWIAATFLGWLTPFATVSLLGTFLGGRNDAFSIVFATLLMGATVAVPQWWMLRRRVRDASWWILAHGFGWCITGLPNLVTSTSKPLAIALMLAIAWMPAIATGFACWLLLDWLPRRNKAGHRSNLQAFVIKGLPIFILVGLMLALLLGRVSRTPPPLEPITPHAIAADAQPVVIDTDMAADDWLAILYLLGRSDVGVQAITVTGAGEAHCSAGTRNALNLVALAGRPEIPVACGRETPLAGDHAFPTGWRERVDRLLGLTLPENSSEVSGESAVELLKRIIQESPQKVHLITLGPLTNVAEALEAEPELVTNLEMITVMGGAVEVAGNVGSSSNIENKVADWNFYVDPRAAAEVLASGAPITLVPLDATNHVPVTMEFCKRLKRDRTTSVAEFVYRVLTAQEEYIRSGGYYFWDPLAAAIATEEGGATFREMPLVVVEEEGPESGRTLQSEQGFLVRVAMTADRERFETLFLDAVNGRLP